MMIKKVTLIKLLKEYEREMALYEAELSAMRKVLTDRQRRTREKNNMESGSGFSSLGIPKPSELIEQLDKFVVGQDEVKKSLAIATINHRYRTMYNKALHLKQTRDTIEDDYDNFNQFNTPSYLGTPLSDIYYDDYGMSEEKSDIEALVDKHPMPLKKSNVLIMGPTGSGKTHIVNHIAKILDVPVYKTDASTLTAAGYIGRDVDDVLRGLFVEAGGNMEKAEQGIIFLDEVDKIAKKRPESVDVGGLEVQNQLLKIIEGTTVKVKASPHDGEQAFVMDTSNILFIFAGSFAEAIKNRDEGDRPASIGFVQEKEIEKEEEIGPKDIIEFGFIPELVGRIGTIVKTKPLTDKQLKFILTEIEDAPMKQAKIMLEMLGKSIDSKTEKRIIREVLKECKELSTGARGLSTMLESKMRKYYYE